MDENSNVAATTGSAITLSMIASVIGQCCIGPWSVALLGVSGAVAMARFAFLKPYILTLAAGLLAWAFWRVYSGTSECTDKTCASKSTPWLRAALWSAVVLIALASFADELQWILVDPTPETLRHG